MGQKEQDDSPTEDMQTITTTTTTSTGQPEEGGLLEGSAGREQSETQHQRQAEVVSLRARGAELEECLIAARGGRTSARERREFMKEEAEQARDYDKKLAQEMARLERIVRALPPGETPSLEKLRRLVATLAEVELQEQAALEEGRAQDAALRAEIDDFTGVTGGGPSATSTTAALEAASPTAATAGADYEVLPEESSAAASLVRRRGRSGVGAVMLEKSIDDPLAAMAEPPKEKEQEDGGGGRAAVGAKGVVHVPRTAVVMARTGATGAEGGRENNSSSGGGPIEKKEKKKPVLEGKALLAEGLHRIEAAYQMAAAEREETASRLSRLRLAVARRQREADAAPGHAELLQYLLRFEELGRHSLERQEQFRRCQAERSTLVLTRELLANQARLLETIAGGVEEALNGPKGAREAYLQQIKGIVEGVEDSLENQQRLLDGARNRRRTAEEIQASVKEDRKRFLAGTKELSDECHRYEALNTHLALMRG
ncbi:unnamed protein product [Pylaiella littoralis]